MNDRTAAEVADWWRTDITDIQPGEIRMRGYPIEQLIGRLSFAQMVWLMLRGEVPSRPGADLLEAMLVAGVDHGPQAPSIAIARIAMTCGIGINNAMGTAANVLGDVHGGAGQQAMELFDRMLARQDQGAGLDEAVASSLDEFRRDVGKYVPGFGHRFHPRDPRGPRLLELLDQAVAGGVVSGRYVAIGRAIEAELERRSGRHLTMNIDGSGAVVLSELGFAPTLGRGLFVLSRSVGILAHAWEQQQQGGRNKGPIPRSMAYAYTGPAPRDYTP